MLKNNFLAKSVKFALIGGAATAALSAPVFAAEEEKKDVERIEVTGSRIKQVDLESTSPVTSLTIGDIKLTGEATVADVLNNAAVNSFGSWRGQSGYGNGGAATSSVNLRGLGSEYTLVLLDGRRMPGTSSSSGTTADTSRIPLAIVERIDILRDGASAVYGSDAVAGVINIITKKNYEGLNFTYDAEMPEVNGGDNRKVTVTGGLSNEKGNVTFTYEHSETNAIFDRDIWRLDDPTYAAYSSYSSVPNAQITSGGWYSNSDFCAKTPNTVDGTDGENSGRCFYSYGEVTKLFGDVVSDSALTNFSYEINDDLTFKGRLSASLVKTDTRYAGTPASTNKPTMAADNPYNPVGEDVTVWMRGAQLGERDTRTETSNIDALVGLVGTIDVGTGIDWEVNVQHSRSNTQSFNSNLLNDDILQTQINSGEYDIFNQSGMSYNEWDAQMSELYGKAAHTGLYRAEFESSQIDGFLSGVLYEEGDITVAGVVGFEYEMIDFTQVSDPQSASGRVSGGSGGDDVYATRDRTSAYTELQIGLPYNVDVNIAARYDEYDQDGDVGAQVLGATFDNVTPQVGVSWRPVDELLLRASWGESFRAPNMGEMFKSQSLSFERALDTLWCDANPGVDANYCRVAQQHKTWFGGNPDLQPEEGESFTTGFVWSPTDELSLELTYYNVELENRISSISVGQLLRVERELGFNPAVIRDPVTGKIDTMYSFDLNLASRETSGFDFKGSYMMETDIGAFKLSGEASYVRNFEDTSAPGADPFDYAGLQDYPELKGNMTLSWTKDDFNAAWTTYYVGKQDSGNKEYGVDYLADVPTYIKHNVQVSYYHEWNGKLTVGVNNLFDKQAPTFYEGTADYRDASTALYDVTGRVVFLRVEQNF